MNNLVYDTKAIIEVTKEFTFDSAHNLYEYEGACKNLHGHTYKLQVTFRGKVDYRGLVVDFKDIKEIVTKQIIKEFDHQHLNDKMNFNTTAENMVVFFYDKLAFALSLLKETEQYKNRHLEVVEVKLWETPTSFATYRGVTLC